MKKKIFFLIFIIYLNSFSNSFSPEEFTEYFPNGNIRVQGLQMGDKRIGFWYYFREDGTKQTELSYVNGEDFFGVKNYNEDGVLQSSGFVKDFKQEGEWFFYDKNGILLLKINFSRGLKNGKFLAFDEKSNPIVVGYFINDYLQDIQSINIK